MDLVKDIFYTAWLACGSPRGMGVLQDNPGASREEVWECVRDSKDYAMTTNTKTSWKADYVFGRMMKFTVELDEDKVVVSGSAEPTPSYQSWCKTYPTYQALCQAAQNPDTWVSRN